MSFVARSLPPMDRDTPELGTAEVYAGVSNANDYYLGLSHEIFMLGLDHKAARDAFTHALRCSAERKPDQLRLAIAVLRDRADAMAAKARKIETMIQGVKP